VTRTGRLVSGAGRLAVLLLAASACSLGDGEGELSSDKLTVEGCWNGPFRLDPDFFAGMPYRDQLSIRMQHGGDTEEVSDGALILVEDVPRVRARIAAEGAPVFRVAQPASIVPPGFPIVADPDPAIVHLTLYLHRACHAQNAALYSLDGEITFRAIFNGNSNESNADEKLTEAEFSDITVGDPRNRVQGGDTVADISHIHGRLKFYFQRGQTAQPFP
jgi:hypothetical protein